MNSKAEDIYHGASWLLGGLGPADIHGQPYDTHPLQSSLFRGHTFWRTLVANEIATVIAGAMHLAGFSSTHGTSKDSMSPYS